MIDEKKLIEELEEQIVTITTPDDPEIRTRYWNAGISYALISIERQPKIGEWIPCSSGVLPENETEVEISCIRRVLINAQGEKKEYHFTARAFYTDGTMTTEDSDYTWDDCDNWEYDEEKDAYIIPEGWWECVSFSEEFGVVDAEVVAWKPLDEPYKEEVTE